MRKMSLADNKKKNKENKENEVQNKNFENKDTQNNHEYINDEENQKQFTKSRQNFFKSNLSEKENEENLNNNTEENLESEDFFKMKLLEVNLKSRYDDDKDKEKNKEKLFDKEAEFNMNGYINNGEIKVKSSENLNEDFSLASLNSDI